MSTLPRRPVPFRVAPQSVPAVAPGMNTGAACFGLRAPAKVNLHLEVLGRRDDGFHELETVMTPLRLADRLWMYEADPRDGFRLVVHGPYRAAVPTDEQNLIVKALKQLCQRVGVEQGARIVLEKNIPAEAGLGGGSSDAAAAIVLADRVWDLDADHAVLCEVAEQVGSDVPFFLTEGSALCRGRGEQITPLIAPAGCHCVVLKPAVGLSTAAVYGALTGTGRAPVDVSPVITSLAAGDWRSVAQRLFNRLQQPAAQLTNGIGQVATALQALSSLGMQMTGSGSAFFALVANHAAARRLAARLRAMGLGRAFVTQTT